MTSPLKQPTIGGSHAGWVLLWNGLIGHSLFVSLPIALFARKVTAAD